MQHVFIHKGFTLLCKENSAVKEFKLGKGITYSILKLSTLSVKHDSMDALVSRAAVAGWQGHHQGVEKGLLTGWCLPAGAVKGCI